MNLFFDLKKIREIRENKNERITELVNSIMQKAEEALEVKEIDESYADDNKGSKENNAQHGNYYDASLPFKKFMPFLGFAYHYSGDRKFFEKAKRLMLLYAGYQKWHGSLFFAKSELNNAAFSFGMACGYDMFYDELSKDERDYIRNETYKKGIKVAIDEWARPETRIHALDTMGHNWWAVCVSMAGVAALVMKKDDPKLSIEYELAKNAIKEWFLYRGNEFNMKPVNIDNGGYYEGVGYLDYALYEYGIFRLAAKRLENDEIFDDTQILKDCVDFFANSFYPSNTKPTMVNFGDSGVECQIDALKILLASGEDFSVARWFLSKIGKINTNIFDLVFYDEIYNDRQKSPNNTDVCYKNIGWAIFRDSFEADSSMLAIKCGDTWNHAHADAASFIYYDAGEEIIGDGGTCSYGLPEYIDYFCSSNAHNTVLFENKGQDRRDTFTHTRLKGKLFGEYFSENIKYICADATGPMSANLRKFLRHFIWIDDFVLIYDDIEALKEGTLQFLIHEKKSGYFNMFTSDEKKICKGYKDHKIDETEDYTAYLQKTDDECRAKFISVLGKDAIEYSLSYDDNVYKVDANKWNIYINKLSDGSVMHKNCINSMGGFETDAILIAVSKNKIFFVNGSFIRKGEQTLFSQFTRKTGIVNI